MQRRHEHDRLREFSKRTTASGRFGTRRTRRICGRNEQDLVDQPCGPGGGKTPHPLLRHQTTVHASIKNNDEWHKENPENGTVKNVIRSVGHEVLTKQSDWEQANPEHSRTITKKKQFNTMCHNTVDGMLDEKAGTKIIRNLANVVAIDRDSDLKDE